MTDNDQPIETPPPVVVLTLAQVAEQNYDLVNGIIRRTAADLAEAIGTPGAAAALQDELTEWLRQFIAAAPQRTDTEGGR